MTGPEVRLFAALVASVCAMVLACTGHLGLGVVFLLVAIVLLVADQ